MLWIVQYDYGSSRWVLFCPDCTTAQICLCDDNRDYLPGNPLDAVLDGTLRCCYCGQKHDLRDDQRSWLESLQLGREQSALYAHLDKQWREYPEREEAERRRRQAEEAARQQKQVQLKQDLLAERIRNQMWDFHEKHKGDIGVDLLPDAMQLYVGHSSRLTTMDADKLLEVYSHYILKFQKLLSKHDRKNKRSRQDEEMQADIDAAMYEGRRTGKSQQEITAEVEYIRQQYDNKH